MLYSNIFSHTSQPCLGQKRHHGNNVLSCPHSNSAQDQGGRLHKKNGRFFSELPAEGLRWVTHEVSLLMVLWQVASPSSCWGWWQAWFHLRSLWRKRPISLSKRASESWSKAIQKWKLCADLSVIFCWGSKGETGSIGSSFNELAVCVCTTWVYPPASRVFSG